jgi:hypothetical protein
MRASSLFIRRDLVEYSAPASTCTALRFHVLVCTLPWFTGHGTALVLLQGTVLVPGRCRKSWKPVTAVARQHSGFDEKETELLNSCRGEVLEKVSAFCWIPEVLDSTRRQSNRKSTESQHLFQHFTFQGHCLLMLPARRIGNPLASSTHHIHHSAGEEQSTFGSNCGNHHCLDSYISNTLLVIMTLKIMHLSSNRLQRQVYYWVCTTVSAHLSLGSAVNVDEFASTRYQWNQVRSMMDWRSEAHIQHFFQHFESQQKVNTLSTLYPTLAPQVLTLYPTLAPQVLTFCWLSKCWKSKCWIIIASPNSNNVASIS